MTDSSKSRFLMAALVMATIYMPAAAKDPKHATARLKFEVDQRSGQSVNQRSVEWLTTNTHGTSSRVSIKRGLVTPTYRAELFIANIPFSGGVERRGGQRLSVDFHSPEAIEKILNTPAGRKISSGQRKFIEGGKAMYRSGSLGDAVVDSFRFWVYAVSRDDVEKTTEAFIQFLTAEAEANMQHWLSECKKISEELIPENKKRYFETLGQIKTVETRLKELKKTVHYVSIEEAMQTVLEFNRILNELDVETAGLQAKVSASKEYVERKELTDEALTEVQQILANHTIELAGAEAREKIAAKVRDHAKSFYDLHMQLDELPKTLKNLENSVRSFEKGLKGAQDKLTDPHGGALPPQVFENEVVINPVRRN